MGYTYKAIGEAVGVHPRTIAHWAQVAEHKGEKAAIAGGQRGVRQGDRRSLSSVCVWASRLAQLNQSPPMRQQLRNLTCPLRRQAREDVLQIGVRVMPVESS